MNDFIKLILSMSLSGSILTFILFAVRPLVKDRFSQAWQYYIWLFVILRMLIPYSPQISVVGSLLHRAETAHTLQGARSFTDTPLITHRDTFLSENIIPNLENSPTTDFSMLPVYLWVLGALFLLILKAAQYKNFIRYIKAGARVIKEEEITGLFKSVCEEMGVRRNIPLYRCKLIKSPMLIGLFSPAIILPEAPMPSGSLSYVFKHELTHLKHWDIWYKWLVQLMVCVHWFNPLAYKISKQINSLCEFACDESISRGLDRTGKMEYGNTLIHAVSSHTVYRGNIMSVTLCEDKKILKERIDTMMRIEKRPKKVIILSVLAAAVFCCTAVFLGAFSTNGMEEKQEPSHETVRNEDLPVEADTSVQNSETMVSNDSSSVEEGAQNLDPKEAFLNSPEGKEFQASSREFAEAYLSGDVGTMKHYLIDPQSKSHYYPTENVFQDIQFLQLKLSPKDIHAGAVNAEYEFCITGQDTYQYLYLEMKRVDNEWKVEFFGLEM